MTKTRGVDPPWGRASTYVLAAGACAVLLVGLLVPLVLADPEPATTTAVRQTAPVAADLPAAGSAPSGPVSSAAAAPSVSGQTATATVGSPVSQRAAASSAAIGGGATGPLPASDRGVTPTEIRVGVLQPDISGIGALGFEFPGFDPEADAAAYRLWADEINRSGGVLGRELTVSVAKYDRTAGGAAAVRAACLTLVEDAQVFAVFDPTGTFTQPGQACITREHQALFLGPHSAVMAEDLAAAGGRLLTTRMSTDRQWNTVAVLSHQDGTLRGKTIGVLTTEFPVENAAARRGLIPRLKALGYKVAHETTLSGDAGIAQSQIPVEVTQMRSKGVDLVFAVTNTIYAQLWAQEGDAQRWAPLYGHSDLSGGAADANLQNMPVSYHGFAFTVTAAEANKNVARDRPQPPIEAECLRRYEAFAKQPLAADTHDLERIRQVNACAFLSFFRDVAAGVGPRLTTPSIVSQAVGAGDLSYWWAEPSQLRFAPGKYDAADAMRRLVATRPCPKDTADRNGCWVPAGDFHHTG